jgi:hypothetical protein
LTIRLGETLSTEHAVSGDTFQATLVDPIVVDGLIVAERGARVTGRIADARRAGRMSGVSSLELRLTASALRSPPIPGSSEATKSAAGPSWERSLAPSREKVSARQSEPNLSPSPPKPSSGFASARE